MSNFLEIAGNDNNILPIEEISYADDRMFNTGVMTVQGLNKPWGYPILQTKLDNKFNFLNIKIRENSKNMQKTRKINIKFG